MKMVYKHLEENNLFLRRTNPDEQNSVKWYYILLSASFSVIVLVVIILLVKRYIRSRHQRSIQRSVFPAANLDPNSAEYIYQHVYQNHKNPVYLVPYSALPENFDFSRQDITVRGDFIILKDLHVLEQPVIRPPSTPTTPTAPTGVHMFLEGNQKQPSYSHNVVY